MLDVSAHDSTGNEENLEGSLDGKGTTFHRREVIYTCRDICFETKTCIKQRPGSNSEWLIQVAASVNSSDCVSGRLLAGQAASDSRLPHTRQRIILVNNCTIIPSFPRR